MYCRHPARSATVSQTAPVETDPGVARLDGSYSSTSEVLEHALSPHPKVVKTPTTLLEDMGIPEPYERQCGKPQIPRVNTYLLPQQRVSFLLEDTFPNPTITVLAYNILSWFGPHYISPQIDYLATFTAIPQPSQQDQRMAGTHNDPAPTSAQKVSYLQLTEVLQKESKQPIPGTQTWDIGTFGMNSNSLDRSKRKRSRGKQSSPRYANASSREEMINISSRRHHNDTFQDSVIPLAVAHANAEASNLHRAAQNLTTPSNLHQSFGQAADSMSGSASSVRFPPATSLADTSQACEELRMQPDQSTSANRNALQLDLFAETGGAIHSSADGAFSWSESSTGNQSMITSEKRQYSGSPSVPNPSPECRHSLVPVLALRWPSVKNDGPYMTGWFASDINDQGSSLETQFSTNGVPNITVVSPDERSIQSIPPPDMHTMDHRSQMNALPPLSIPAYTHLREPQSSIPGSASSSGSSELFSTPESAMSYSFPSPYSDVEFINDSFLASHMYPTQY
ncbi:hypothetical protein A7U60_g4740 [Sanghuangporus baumii]|uniref:Uncharacterized protein n=1 Tax=Sanghuangporus baumii TaxID=108892 RepID=A0A9Q5NC26_SANBA|nr:hypothetical protein A7U60_g4740 [Sanghuangporus baumii]